MIPLKIHSVMDYLTGAFLLLAPFFFGFGGVDSARNVFLVAGLFVIMYSLFTDYEFSVLRAIPVSLHMTFEAAVAVVLMVAPWVMNYRLQIPPQAEVLHYVCGGFLLVLIGFTRSERVEAQRYVYQGPVFRSRVNPIKV